MSDPASQQSGIERVTQPQAQQATERETLGRVPALEDDAGDPYRQGWLGGRNTVGKAPGPGERCLCGIGAALDQRVDLRRRKVEPGKTFDCRPDEDVIGLQGISGLLKEESEQPVGQDDRGVEIDRIGEPFRGIRYDDALSAGRPRCRNGNVGRETAVCKYPPAQ